jgi:hypothetical protein
MGSPHGARSEREYMEREMVMKTLGQVKEQGDVKFE